MDQTGLSRDAVDVAIDLYGKGGWNTLKPRPQGKPVRTGRSLTADQEAQIQRLICEKRPEQRKMEFALWNRAPVM